MVIKFSCEICGKYGKRCYAQNKVPNHFFCSRCCQNKWQESREDLIIKNKDPEFRKKVSRGLKNRKKLLGDNYHSKETKEKIGAATVANWNKYNNDIKKKMLQILYNNAQRKRTFKPYDCDWQKISAALRKQSMCERCGKREKLIVHHIQPVKYGGTRNIENLSVLCMGCHRTVESQTNIIYDIIRDLETVSYLVRSKLRLRRVNNGNFKIKNI